MKKILKFDYEIDDNGCWNCKNTSINVWGYPQSTINYVTNYVYRHIFRLEVLKIGLKDKLPHGTCIRHICNNKLCINPNHLKLGTQMDNIQDAVLTGVFQKGENNSNSKLTENNVRLIKNCYRLKIKNQRELSEIFDVSQALISDIISGKKWGNII